MQDYFTYAKVFALIMIIVTGFVQLGNGYTEYFTWEGTETDPSKIGRRSPELPPHPPTPPYCCRFPAFFIYKDDILELSLPD